MLFDPSKTCSTYLILHRALTTYSGDLHYSGMAKVKQPTSKILAYIKLHFTYNPDIGDVRRDGRICKTATAIVVGGKIHYARNYQVAWFLTYGAWPTTYIDHHDGNRGNNKLTNLRSATPSQNSHNGRKVSKPTTSKYKGVKLVGCRWRAYINNNYKMIHIGYFTTEEGAAKAYDIKARELHGEFARLNFGTNNALEPGEREQCSITDYMDLHDAYFG